MVDRAFIRLQAHKGVELWHAVTDGVEHFTVRFGHRRARALRSLTAAQALFADLVKRGEQARAH